MSGRALGGALHSRKDLTSRMAGPGVTSSFKQAGLHPLTAPVHLAFQDSTGRLAMPPGTRSVLVEIGCSDRDTLDEAAIDHYARSHLVSVRVAEQMQHAKLQNVTP